MGCGASTASAPAAPDDAPAVRTAAFEKPDAAVGSVVASEFPDQPVGQKSEFNVPETVAEVERVPCDRCGRFFALDRIKAHQIVCKSLKIEPNPLEERTKPGGGGGGGGAIGGGGKSGGREGGAASSAAWRGQSDELRAAKQAAKKVPGGGDWEAVCVVPS